jgi:hypothetical protein
MIIVEIKYLFLKNKNYIPLQLYLFTFCERIQLSPSKKKKKKKRENTALCCVYTVPNPLSYLCFLPLSLSKETACYLQPIRDSPDYIMRQRFSTTIYDQTDRSVELVVLASHLESRNHLL